MEGNLYFMKSRFYDPLRPRAGSPVIGRFLQPDSIVPDPADPQSLNRYSYVLNNPLRYTDPTGHWVEGLAQASLGSGCGWDFSTGAPDCDASIQGRIVIQPMPPIGDPDLDDWMLTYCGGRCGAGPLAGSSALLGFGEEVLRQSPFLGTGLGICGGLTGNDCLTGEGLPAWQRGAGAVPGIKVLKLLRPAGRALRFLDWRPAGTAAHHIVAVSDRRAAGARAALARFGIDIHAAENRVVLPANLSSPNPAGSAVHSITHTNGYYLEVNQVLGQAVTRDDALERLEFIRQRLLRNEFP